MRVLIVVIGALLTPTAMAQDAPAAGASAWVASAPPAVVPEAVVPEAVVPEAASNPAVSEPAAAAPAAPVPPPREAVAPDAAASDTAAAKPADRRETYRKILRDKAVALGVPYELADAVTEVESSYNGAAVGGVGEIGLMQVLPSTARMLGFDGTLAELAEPETNIHYGVTYLAQAWRLAERDVCTTVMKYRAGHGESRFSHRSVDYCIRVRRGLAARGYTVTGEVPKATFGEPVGGGTRVAGNRVRKKSRLNWTAADARWRSVTSKINSANLMIMQ